MILIKRKRSY